MIYPLGGSGYVGHAYQALFKRKGVAFRSLRQMPPAQRQEVINSARFRAQFSDPEREALSNILAVEPYPPVGGQR